MSTVYEYEGLSYRLEEGEAELVGATRKDFTALTVPSELTHGDVVYPVTRVARAALAGLDRLESISLPFIGSDDSATRESLFGYIFGATQYARVIPGDRVYDTPDIHISCNNYEYVPESLRRVTVGGSLVGKQAFCGCSHIEEVIFADTVGKIEEDAFRGCESIKSVTLPHSVKGIGWNAFCGCDSLESVQIEEGVTYIGKEAFANCKSLKSISLPGTVKEIASDAFRGCTRLKYRHYGHCAYLGNAENPYHALVRATDRGRSSYPIVRQTKIICDGAFYECKALCEIKIPRGVTVIGDEAFHTCLSLTSVQLPKGLESIGSFAFESTPKIEGTILPPGIGYIGTCAFRWTGPVYLCEEEAPKNWHKDWCYSNYKVTFGYKAGKLPQYITPKPPKKRKKTRRKR